MLWTAVVVALAAGVVAAWVARLRAGDRRAERDVWAALEAGRPASPPLFRPDMLDGLPEIARRYFTRAIAPGTPLARTVRLEMIGEFVLGDKSLPLRASQILSPPAAGFVWKAVMGSGPMRFIGSDGFYRRPDGSHASWTRFWLAGIIPVARAGGTADHARSAATRDMMEGVWTPAALLPAFGARWRQTGPDAAEIGFDATPDLPPMRLTFSGDGDIVELTAMRWTDANADKAYRLQPFGGRMLESGVFGGFRIPVRVELGNMHGTADYKPFFFATIVAADYGSPALSP